MNRNSKKGFTIVELIIVIAVIAVLAAVLIPTFSNLIQKANVAADQTLIKNLNTALAMDTDVSKHETMTQALDATKANGFDVEKIVARATKNRIVWDSVNDCFAYIEEGKTEPTYIPDTKTDAKVEKYQLWTIVDSTTLDATYSSYIAGTSVTGVVTATKGVDVGENTGITAVTYKNETTTAQTVAIRTNGGTLEVNAPLDTVKRYGTVENVTITAVAPQSYHEFGEVVGNLEIKSGRVVVETGASIGALVVDPATETSKVEVASNGGSVAAVVTTTDVGSNVVIPEALKPTKIDETKKEEMSKFAGGIGTEASPYLIANTTNFNNIFTALGKEMNNGKYFYFRQTGDVTISTTKTPYYFNGHYDGGNNGIYADKAASGVLYVFGISKNNIDVENLNVYSTEKAGLTLVGYSITSIGYTKLFYNGSASFKNVNTYAKDGVTVNLEGNNAANFGFFTSNAIYYYNGSKEITVELENCNNYASIINSDRSAAFIGSYDGLDDGAHAKVIMKNCANYGDITVTSDDAAGAIIANSYATTGWSELNEQTLKTWISLESVKNYGLIKGKTATAFGNAPSTHILNKVYQDEIGGTYVSTEGVLKGVTANVFESTGKFYVVGSNTNYTYKTSVIVGAIVSSEGSFNSRSADLVVGENNGNGTQITSVHAYDYNTAVANGAIASGEIVNYAYDCAGFRMGVVQKNGTLYLIFDNAQVTEVNSSVKLIAKVYNVSGEYVGALDVLSK